MEVREVPVYGIPRAEDGATAGLDIASLLGDTKDANAIELMKFLLQYGGSKAAPPVGDVLAEQRERAKLQAESQSPYARYLPDLAPGGLWDTMAGFIGGLGLPGVGTPSMEEAQRYATPASLGDLGSTFEEALGYAQKAVPAENKYDAVVQGILAPLMERMGLTPKTPTDTETAASEQVARERAAFEAQGDERESSGALKARPLSTATQLEQRGSQQAGFAAREAEEQLRKLPRKLREGIMSQPGFAERTGVRGLR